MSKIQVTVDVNMEHLISLLEHKDPEEMEKFIRDLVDSIEFKLFQEVLLDKIIKNMLE